MYWKYLALILTVLLIPFATSQAYSSDSCGDPDGCDFSMNTDSGTLVVTGYSTASTGNNCDWTFGVNVDGSTVASVTEGDSDNSVDDTQAFATTIEVGGGSHSINTYENNECSPNYRETQVSAFMASTMAENVKSVSCSDPDACDFSLDTANSNVLLLAHSSASTGNNQDWSFNIDLNGNRIATSKEGDSDTSVYDTQFLTSIAPVSSGSQSVNAYESHEGSPSWRETQVTLMELRNDVFQQSVSCSNPDNCDFSVSHDSTATFIAGHASAETSKNNEWTFGINRDGTNIGEVKEGNSNINVFDAQGINAISEDSDFNLNTYQTNEGTPNWRETQVVAVEIKNSSGLSSICDKEGPNGECISNSTHGVNGGKFNVSRKLEVRENALFKAENQEAIINVTNSSSISGVFRGSFKLIADRHILRRGASFTPSGGDIRIVQ